MSESSSSTTIAPVRVTPRGILQIVIVIGALIGFAALTHSRSTAVVGGSAPAYCEGVHYAVSPLALGRIETLLARVGQNVKAGEPLAVLDKSALIAARERAAAQLAELEAEVVATAQDEEFQVTRSELWVLKARADEQGNRAELAQIAERMNRLDALLGQQMIPAAQAEVARERQRTLQARVGTFDQAKLRGQAGLGQSGAGNHSHARAVEIHVEPMRRQVQVQELAIRQLDLQIEQLTLRAPVDGVVTTISHHVGEVVSAGDEVLSIVAGRPGVLIAELPESMAARAHIGQGVTVRSRELFSRSLHGRVIELAPEVDEMIVRARPSPGIAAWGRRAAIQLESGGERLPGESFSVSLD